LALAPGELQKGVVGEEELARALVLDEVARRVSIEAIIPWVLAGEVDEMAERRA